MNKLEQTKEKAFGEWFIQRFNVDNKGKFMHQDMPFTLNMGRIMVFNPFNDYIEIIFTDNWLNYINPKISLTLSSKYLDNVESAVSKEKLAAMMATIDIVNICNQYLKDMLD